MKGKEDRETDILVIGGGAAGLMAALTAARSGAATTLVTGGTSATAFSTGCIDIAGYVPPVPSENIGSSSSSLHHRDPKEAIDGLIRTNPHHPYHIISSGETATATGMIQTAMDAFTTALAIGTSDSKPRLGYLGSLEEYAWLPTHLGTWRPTCFPHDWLAHGNAPRPLEDILIVGFEGYQKFSPGFLAKMLPYTYKLLEAQIDPESVHSFTPSLSAAYMVLEPLRRSFNIHWRELDHVLRDDEVFAAFLEQLITITAEAGCAQVGLPSIFSCRHYRQRMTAIEEAVNLPIIEIALPLSAAGERLTEALIKAAVAAGVRILNNYRAVKPVLHSSITGEQTCAGFEIASPLTKLWYHARSVIIATGDMITMGQIWREGKWHEPLMGLPLAGEDGHEYAVHPSQPFPVTGHPVSKLGVRTDASLCPIDAGGRRQYSNVRVAGAVLAGYDHATEKSGLGVSLTTGYFAGKYASEEV